MIPSPAPTAASAAAGCRLAAVATLALAVTLGGCAATAPSSPPPGTAATPGHTVVVALDDASLLRVDAGDPARVLHRARVTGLLPDERLMCLDFRPGNGRRLYALTSADRLLTVDVSSGAVAVVATRLPLAGRRLGCDFAPAGDALRVVSDVGVNLRLDPDSGRVLAQDGMLAGDTPPTVVAVASSHGRGNPAAATLYGIDAVDGSLARHGSAPGARPAVSPSSGRTTTIGPLGTGPLEAAAFDIAPADDTAIAVLSVRGTSRLYRVDLSSGRASPVGVLPGRVWGLAVEP